MKNGLAKRGVCAAMVASVLFGPGCANTRGPELVVNSHVDYNKAVGQVLKEELLLNVVRRRYMDPLQFVTVSSISTNIGMTVNANASTTIDNSATNNSGNFGLGSGAGLTPVGNLSGNVSRGTSAVGNALNFSSIAAGGGVGFSDSPTVTITPRQGEDISRQLHDALPVSAVADLVSAGFPVSGAIQMLVEDLNGVRGPTLAYDKFRAGSPEWREAIGLIRRFSEDGSFIIDRFLWNDPYNEYPYPAASITPEMWITTLSTGARRWRSYDGGKTFFFTSDEMAPAAWLDDKVRQSPDGARLVQLLNLQPEVMRREWLLEPARTVQGPDFANIPNAPRPTLKLRMRSLDSVITLYSYIVEVPPGDEAKGAASDMSAFREVVGRGDVQNFPESIAIKWSKCRPASAFLAVPYRGLWFYIDDGDQRTKMIFGSLYDLWQLSVKQPSSQTTPVTTIQVN